MRKDIREHVIWLSKLYAVKIELNNIGMENLFTSKQHLSPQILCGKTNIGQLGSKFLENSQLL